MVAQSDDDEEEMDWEEGLACVSCALEKDHGSRLAPVPVGDDTCKIYSYTGRSTNQSFLNFVVNQVR